MENWRKIISPIQKVVDNNHDIVMMSQMRTDDCDDDDKDENYDEHDDENDDNLEKRQGV